MADIPGIIEGASEGKGLGFRFLRHIERNSLLLFLVPADADDIRKEYEILLNELKQYNPELLDKRHVLAISKSDMLDEELMQEIRCDLPEVPSVFISSITGFGIPALKDILWRELNADALVPVAVSHGSLVHRDLDVTVLGFEEEETFPEDLISTDEEEAYDDEDDFPEEEA